MSGVQGRGRRVEAAGNERKGVLAILIATTVIAVACAVVPSVWASRAGVLVALVGAWISVFMAWREVDALRAAHFAELKAVRHSASEQERRHHAESMEMIDTFSQRVGALSQTLAQTRAKLDRAENELSTLRGDKAALQYKVSAGNKKVNLLEARVAELETELERVLTEARAGELVAMPEKGAALPDASQIWEGGNDSTIVDLSRVAFPTAEEIEHRRQA